MHERVAAVVDAYLRAVQAEAPGLVEGLYLTGSVALGEFRPRTSDIDYLAVTGSRARPPRPSPRCRAHTVDCDGVIPDRSSTAAT